MIHGQFQVSSWTSLGQLWDNSDKINEHFSKNFFGKKHQHIKLFWPNGHYPTMTLIHHTKFKEDAI